MDSVDRVIMGQLQIRITTITVTVVWALLAIINIGCDGSGSGPTNTDRKNYRFVEVLTKDPNLNSASAAARFTRNDTLLTDADIVAGSITLVFTDDQYIVDTSQADHFASGNILLEFSDSLLFTGSVSSTIPADLQITQVQPDRREKLSFEHVQLSWSGSAGANGYVIAAALRDSVYTSIGYSCWVTTQTTSATFDDNAFSRTTLQGTEPVPGIYYLYVYAYSGRPDSALSANKLPVPLPSQLADNIDQDDLNGHHGSVVVTLLDSMRVIAE